jgi:hypothetical protein
MLYKSKRCDPRPKARDVPLTWARASAYRDRAIEYLKLAHLAPDRNVQKRFIAIGRRYCTLAEFGRRTAAEAASDSHQSQNTVNQNHSGPFTSFAFVLMIIVSGTTTTVPFDLARASDCLAAPNSPAPKGSHWHYHLNRETQQKCWHTRSSEKQPQRATAQTSSGDAAVPSTSAGQTGSTAAHDIDGPSGQGEPPTKAIQDPASNTIPNRSASQIAPREDTELPASRESNSSDTGIQATAPTAVVWPDPPPPRAAAINAREANAVVADAALGPVPDNADSAGSNSERTSEFEIPIIVFPALAIGLVVIGFGARLIMKGSAARRAQTVDPTEAVTISDEDHAGSSENRRADRSTGLGEDDFQSFVSAVSGRGPLERIVGSVQTTNEISAREARLAQLREDIDRRLRWPEPTRAQPPKQPVAC